MKELSIKEKAKAYDEALERARIWQNNLYDTNDKDYADELNYIFPELKEEPEDERIRKALINVFATHKDYEMFFGVSVKDILAWLEKQEQSKKISIWKHWKDGIAGNGDGIPVFLIKNGSTYSLSSVLGFECDYIELSELDNLMLEKQGEQKLTDKVEPKFHEGEWITNGNYTWKIVGIKPLDYILQSQDGNVVDDTISHVNEQFHSFTIEDAKDGDVLAAQECYVIFKEIDGLNIKCYCTYHYMGFNPSFRINTLQNKTAFHPATKEQRDALKKAITKAGYRWDEDKKEFNQTPIS